MISTILLVPAPGDPHGLLADGACGARVPLAWRPWLEDYGSPTGGEWADVWVFGSADDYTREESAALVLAHRGALAPEGWDRLRRVVWRKGLSTGMWAALSEPELSWQVIEWVAATAAAVLSARVVCLDADGREVTRG